MESNDKIKAYLAYAFVCLFWGTTYLAIRIGVAVMPPGLFAGIRFFLAGIIFLPLLLMNGYKLPKKEELLPIAIVGIALLSIANGAVVWAEQFVSSSLAALIVTTLPIFMVTFESLLSNGEKFTTQKITGILIGFVGVFILLWPDLHGTLDTTFIKGIAAITIAPISWAAGSIYSKYRKINTPPLVAAASQMIIAGLILIIFGSIKGEWAAITLNFNGWAALAYLAVFGSIIGYGSYIYALDKLPAAMVSTYAYINPIVAVFLGWLILNERLDEFTIVATVIILFGVTMVKKTQSKKIYPQTSDDKIEFNSDPGLPLSCEKQ